MARQGNGVVDDVRAGREATVSFSGTRWALFGILLRGYFLMVPTIGIYRFWLVTATRRFYWSHTEIDGDALDYTGSARQLLIGFLFAVAIFLPLYGVFFWLSTQSPQVAILGYAGVGVFLYFLAGYAMYRARRFRLTRTFWRGIRFHQTGSAWGYALRRFLWTVLMIPTLGLAWPFMTASLWRYRYNHTWYGDRRFASTASWRMVAGPFYLVYLLLVAGTVATFALVPEEQLRRPAGEAGLPDLPVLAAGGLTVLGALWGWVHVRARSASRLFSSVRAGAATLTVRIRARALLGQSLAYGVVFTLATAAFLVGFALVVGRLADGRGEVDMGMVLAAGPLPLIMLIAMYLVLLGVYGLFSQLILGLGWWRLVARGTVIGHADDLRSVRARGEESPLAGEGLADAMNVGAY